MLTLELLHNGQHVATAGLPGHHFVEALVVLANVKGYRLDTYLNGYDRDEDRHYEWAKVRPVIGDELVICVAEDAPLDSPSRCHESPKDEPRTVEDIRRAIADYEGAIAQIQKAVEANRPIHRTAEGIRFEVSVDGVRRCVAGLPREGILTASVESSLETEERELRLTVGGTESAERHLYWAFGDALTVPSVVRIVLLGPGEVDPPSRQSDHPPGSDEDIATFREILAEEQAKLAALLDKK